MQRGLKTGMYYLRTRAAADAIKFTVDQLALAKTKAARVAAKAAAVQAPAAAPLKVSTRTGMHNGRAGMSASLSLLSASWSPAVTMGLPDLVWVWAGILILTVQCCWSHSAWQVAMPGKTGWASPALMCCRTWLVNAVIELHGRARRPVIVQEQHAQLPAMVHVSGKLASPQDGSESLCVCCMFKRSGLQSCRSIMRSRHQWVHRPRCP